MPLNPRQLKFVERYLATGNATQSYIDAGYTKDHEAARRNSSRLLTNADVCAAVEEARRKANESSGITAEWYARRVKLEAEREDKGSSHAARVSALKLAGDLLGVGELHKHQHSGPGGGAIPLANLSDDDLDSLERVLAKCDPVPPAELGGGEAGAGGAGLRPVPDDVPAEDELGLAAPQTVPLAPPPGD